MTLLVSALMSILTTSGCLPLHRQEEDDEVLSTSINLVMRSRHDKHELFVCKRTIKCPMYSTSNGTEHISTLCKLKVGAIRIIFMLVSYFHVLK
jgi:hypothetical protein